MTTLVVDNGAYTVKCGVISAGTKAGDFAAPELPISPSVLPNCTAKSRAEKKFFVADGACLLLCPHPRQPLHVLTPSLPPPGLNSAVDLSALYTRRPHERGYVVNWDIEEEVWNRMCHKDMLGVKPSETSLFVSEVSAETHFPFSHMRFAAFLSAKMLCAVHPDPASGEGFKAGILRNPCLRYRGILRQLRHVPLFPEKHADTARCPAPPLPLGASRQHG